MEDLQSLRGQIDALDAQIVDLFRRRMDVTYQVGLYKVAHHMQVLDDKREAEVLAKKTALVDDSLKTDVTTLFETIMAISRRQQRMLVEENDPWYAAFQEALDHRRAPLTDPRVLYQGEPGAYAEEAAIRFFGATADRTHVTHWEDIFEALREGRADYGVVPIENSSTGAINQVYDLLGKYGAYVVGEQTVRVSHCLMAPQGARLEDLRDIYSHEQGLLQCADYLRGHPGAQHGGGRQICSRAGRRDQGGHRLPAGGGALWAEGAGGGHQLQPDQCHPVRGGLPGAGAAARTG